MAIVMEQADSGTGESDTPTLDTGLTTVDSGSHVILVAVGGSSGVTTPPSGYTQAYLVEDITGGGGAGAQWMGCWWKASPSSTEDPTIVCNESEEWAYTAYEVSGLVASPEDGPTGNSAYQTIDVFVQQPGTTGTLAQAEEFVVLLAYFWTGDQGLSVDSGFTEQFDLFDSSFMKSEHAYKITSATTALNPSTTADTSDGPGGAIIQGFKGGAVTQDMTPGLATELVNTFDPALTTGAVDMTPGLAQELVNPFDPTLIQEQFTTPDMAQELVNPFDPKVLMRIRPNVLISADGWDTGPTGGQSLPGYTSDDSDATWVEDTPA